MLDFDSRGSEGRDEEYDHVKAWQMGEEYGADREPAAGRGVAAVEGLIADGLIERVAGAAKCPVCVYGEPVGHTCDEGQQSRYAVEYRGRDGA